MSATVPAPVQMLWVGGPLSALERLALTSWLAHGHEVHLYTYGRPANAPKGLRICNAADILPRGAKSTEAESAVAATRFSDLFRYTLLQQRGGIWVDIDVVCLRPLDFASTMDYFFASAQLPAQPGDDGRIRVRAASCVMKAPAASPLLAECVRQAGMAAGGAPTGPLLLHGIIENFNMTSALLSPNVFCPIPFWSMSTLLHGLVVLPPESYGLHLWNESWQRNYFDKNASYEPHSLFERLKSHYLGRKEKP